MNQVDLLNSHDVLSVAHRWPDAYTDALSLAQRMSSTADIEAEVNFLADNLGPARQRETYWDRVSLLGLATMVLPVLAGILLLAGVALPAEFIEMVFGSVGRWLPILGVFFFLVIASTVGSRAVENRQDLEARLELMQPLVDQAACEAALEFVEAGRPEVLAWRDIALRDRGTMYMFDVDVLEALHNASMDARPAEEKEAAAAAARLKLYGNAANSAPAA